MQSSAAKPAPAATRKSPRRRSWVLLLLIVALILALVIGLVAIGSYFVLRGQRTDRWTWQDPLVGVDPTRIRADIAVLALLEEPGSSTVQEALQAGEPDTAYAVLAHSATMNAVERSGNLLALGKAFQQEGARSLAALSYQQMHDLAALSVSMPDYMRAQSSLDAAEGFIGLEMAESAKPSLAQAEVLARYSPLMAPIQRQQVAERLQRLYRKLSMTQEADDLAQFIRDPQGLPNDAFVRGPFLPGFLGTVALSPQLQAAKDERIRQVYAFVQAWDSSDAARVEAARSGLAGALLAEDGVRQAVTAASLDATPDLPGKAAVLQEQVNWLALKYMIANRGLGYSLVPEWEKDVNGIRSKLGAVYDQLFGVYRDQASALPDERDAGAAYVEILRLENGLGRLGLYPTYDPDGLALALEDAQAKISDQLPLLIVDEPWGSGIVFRLAESFE